MDEERVSMMYFALLVAGLIVFAAPTRAQLRPDDESGKIKERFESFRNRRIPPGITLPEDIRVRAIDAARILERGKALDVVQVQQPVWTSIGPRSTAGRVKDIIIHPTDPNRIFIGAAAGGIWRSTNGGTSWTPLTDDANATAMGSLWFHPQNPDIIFAGTGEQVTNANTFLGAGVMKSTDGGDTWQTIGLTHVGSVSRIYAHPKNPDLLMAACMNTNQGVYKSIDGGATWTRMLNETVYDMTINPADENEWFVGVRSRGILYTSDGGNTWQERMNGLFGAIGRTSIKQSPTNPSVLYVLMEINDLAVIAKSTDRGQNWEVQYNDTRGCFFAGSCNPANSQGFYDNYVAINPTDPDVCFAGGIDVWRTTNGGTTWLNLTSGYADGDGQNVAHVDQHCLAFVPGTSTVYAGNDGGMMRSTDNGTSWTLINNGLVITQFYDFDNDPSRRERSFGGTQDNGTLGTFGDVEWDTVWGGDGMVTIVRHDDPDVVYGNNPNGVPFRLDFGTTTGRQITGGLDLNEAARWDAPMVTSPEDGANLLHGRRRVWRTFDAGDFWFPISASLVNEISALAISPVDPSVLWAASEGGEIMVSEFDGDEWTLLPRRELSNRFISDIQCSRWDRETAWVTYGSYGGANVWKTTDLGASWIPVWGNMPDVAVNGLAVHPDDENILFVATDVGVFATFDGGSQWVPYGKGLPRTVVTGIKLNQEFGYLRCVTHGRGAWEVPLLSTAPTDPIITAPAGAEIFTGTLFTTIAWSGFTPPVRIEYSVDDGSTWKPLAENVNGSAYRWQVPNWPTIVGRIRITSQQDNTQQEVSRTFTITTLQRGGIVQQVSVPWVPYGIAWDGKDGLWTTSFYEAKLYKLDATTLQLIKSVSLPEEVGDSLFTDLTFDRTTGRIYMNRLNGSDGVGATVYVLDTNGRLLWTFSSPARRYATGLEFVNGILIAGERDGFQNIYRMETDGIMISEEPNACRVRYGPRSIGSDDDGNLYQVCTNFPSDNQPLTDCYAIRFSTSDLSTELERLPLVSNQGIINARGIEFDRTDRNFWISDFGGNIYKVTGFGFVPPPVTSVSTSTIPSTNLRVRPNPCTTSAIAALAAVPEPRSITLTLVNNLGAQVSVVFRGEQEAGVDVLVPIVTSGLHTGCYTLIAESNGRRIATTSMIVLE